MPQVPENQMSERICCICPFPTGSPFIERARRLMDMQTYVPREVIWYENKLGESSVGKLRNECIKLASEYPSTDDPAYIAHWDHDDIWAPTRLQRQLDHIRETGKLVTGFYNCPMYDVKNDKVWIYTNPHPSYSLGNCLFYKREAWERVKFPDMTPEDNLWRKNIGGENIEPRSVFEPDGSPLMIQVVHGANASASIIRSSVYYQEPSETQEKAVRELLASA